MPKKQTRANDYYLNRMKTEPPVVHGDYAAGKLTARQAIIKAGYQKDPGPLMILKREWKKASAQERRDFLTWWRAGTSSTPKRAAGRRVATADARLELWSKTRIWDIMAKRKLKTGKVMTEMGLDPRDTSLGSALRRGSTISPDLISRLEKWLKDNKHI